MRLDGGISLNTSDREMIDFIRDGLALSLPLATETFVVRTALSWLAREIRQKGRIEVPAPPPEPFDVAMAELRAKQSPGSEERFQAEMARLATMATQIGPPKSVFRRRRRR